MSYHIAKLDFGAHHQEIEVQTQNMEKGRKLNAYIGTKSCKATKRKCNALSYLN